MTSASTQTAILYAGADGQAIDKVHTWVRDNPSVRWAGLITHLDGLEKAVAACGAKVVAFDPGDELARGLLELGHALKQHPAVRAVMISRQVNMEHLEMALDVGAWGHLTREEVTGCFSDAVQKVVKDELYLSPAFRRLIDDVTSVQPE